MKNRALASKFVNISLVASMAAVGGVESNLHADLNNNMQLALEIARSKKIDKAIDRVSALYDYINLYILQTGDINPTKEKITDTYHLSSASWKGYDSTKEVDFKIDKNIVTFTNVVPTNISDTLKKFYKNSPSLNPLGSINDSDLSISIALDPKAIKVKEAISLLDKSKTIVSQTEPSTCDPTKTWYEPTGDGNLKAHICSNGSWQEAGGIGANGSKIVADSLDKLKNLSAKKGTIGYVSTKDGVEEYIFDGKEWKKTKNESQESKTIVESFSDVKDPKKGQTIYKKAGDNLIEYTYDGESWLRVTPEASGGGTTIMYANKNAGTKYDGNADVASILNKLFNSEGGSKTYVYPPGKGTNHREWEDKTLTFTKIDDVATGGFWHNKTSDYSHILIVKSIKDIPLIKKYNPQYIGEHYKVIFPDGKGGYYTYSHNMVVPKLRGWWWHNWWSPGDYYSYDDVIHHYNDKNEMYETFDENLKDLKTILEKNFKKYLDDANFRFYKPLSDYNKFFTKKRPLFKIIYDKNKDFSYLSLRSSDEIKLAFTSTAWRWSGWWRGRKSYTVNHKLNDIKIIQNRDKTPTPTKNNLYITIEDDCNGGTCENPDGSYKGTKFLNGKLNAFRYTKYYDKAKNHLAEYEAPVQYLHNGLPLSKFKDETKYLKNKVLYFTKYVDIAFSNNQIQYSCKLLNKIKYCRIYLNIDAKFSKLDKKNKIVITGNKTFKQKEKITDITCSSYSYAWTYDNVCWYSCHRRWYRVWSCNRYTLTSNTTNYTIDTGYVEEKEGFNYKKEFANLPKLDGLLQHNDSTIHSAAYDKFKTMFTRKFNEVVNSIKSYDKNSGFDVSYLPSHSFFQSISNGDNFNKIQSIMYNNNAWWYRNIKYYSTFSTNLYYEKEE